MAEVTATLRLRDEMSAQTQAAAAAVQKAGGDIAAAMVATKREVADLEAAMQKYGVTSGGVATGVASTIGPMLDEARLKMAALQQQATATGAAQQQMGAAVQGSVPPVQAFGVSAGGASSAVGGLTAMLGPLTSALSVAALVSFEQSLLDTAYNLNKLSLQTGIGTQALQEYAAAGIRAGVSVDQMALAISMLERNIESETPNAVSALRALGLSLSDLQGKTPQEQFEAVAGALRHVKDHAEQVALGYALMGRGSRSVIGMMTQDLDDMKQQAAADWLVVSESSQKTLADTAIKIKTHWAEVKVIAAEGTAYWIDNFQKITPALTAALRNVPIIGQLAGLFSAGANAAGLFNMATENTAVDLAAVEAAARKVIAARGDEIDKAKELDNWLQDLRKSVEPLTGAMKDNVDEALALGAAHSDIAKRVGVTVEAVKAEAEALKAVAVAAKEAARVEQAATIDSEKRWAEYYASIEKDSGNWELAEHGKIDKWAADQIKAHKSAKTDTADFYGWLSLQAAEMTKQDAKQYELQDTNSRASFEKRKQDADNWLNYVMAHLSDFSQKDVQMAVERDRVATQEYMHWPSVATANLAKVEAATNKVTEAQKKLNDELEKARKKAQEEADALEKARQAGGDRSVTSTNFAEAIASYITGMGAGGAGGTGGVVFHGLDGAQALELAKKGYSFQEIISLLMNPLPGGFMPPPAGPRIPGFGRGVRDFEGGPAVVGEYGPEVVDLPPHANVYERGGAGPTIVNNFYVNGSIRDLARDLMAELSRSMHQLRQWPSA